MHFCYIDETGCNGRCLTHIQQPIFVMGGIILRDGGWNKTYKEFNLIIENYFEGDTPDNFELHAHELLSPRGDGHFENHDRETRNELALDLLKLVKSRKHHIAYLGIHKNKLRDYDVSAVRDRDYFDLKVPYLIAYDYLISLYDSHIKEKRGRSARALVIIDEKDIFINEIEAITEFRRYKAPLAMKIKWITEFSYPLNSKKNPMIQLTDLILFLTRKFLEIENGYKEDYSSELKNVFREFYKLIDDRLIIKKTLRQEEGRHATQYNNFIDSIVALPTARWRSRNY